MKKIALRFVDTYLFTLLTCLVLLGVVMVASTTLFLGEKHFHDSIFFLKKHLVHLGIGCLAFYTMFRVKVSELSVYRVAFLVISLLLLMVVYLPGFGVVVNGAKRWVSLGFFMLQPSELAKFCFIIFVAGYCSKKRRNSSHLSLLDAAAIFSLLAVCDVLLFLQPDFGSAIVLSCIVFHMMWLAGLPALVLVVLLACATVAAFFLIRYVPYRLLRVTSFMDPWAFAYSSGYQLTQSLIAIGRGGLWGVGLGNSLQKIFYLPEAHTDFVFAIICEELGFVGGCCVLLGYMLLVLRLYYWSYNFAKRNQLFYAYYTVGLASWFAMQVSIAVGVNIGLLPTKGLALPLISYGGSNLVTILMGFGLFFAMQCRIKKVSSHKYHAQLVYS